ncbi:MAG: lysylphosphatidylglycerol synthetase family protein [Acetobacteraceae bacterium]|nr:lysylphosphatidylglycerol synthetase family protein [Acetobacteraceae bacterium]
MKGWLRHAPAFLGVGLLLGAIYVVQREFRHLRITDIQHALSMIPDRALLISFAWTVVSYGTLTFYDRLGTFYAGKPVSTRRVAFASFCAYALAHNLGFAAVSGAAVRYRLYAHWGLSPLQIGKVIAFCSLTFGLGGMVLGGIILWTEPSTVPFFGDKLPAAVLQGVGVLLWAIVAGYIALASIVRTFTVRGHRIELPGWRMAIVQVALATVDVGVTAAIFYSLLPAGIGLTYPRLLGVYLASYSAGLAANLPGGLGVFDTAMLLGLARYLEPPQIIGAILIFRLYYYIIPLFLAGALFSGNEILLRGKSFARLDGGFRWSEPDLSIAIATGTVALCGALLLSIGALSPQPDYSWIDPDFAEVVNSAGQFVPSLIGAALLVLSVSISQRVTLAWGGTLVMLMIAAAFLLAQGRYWEAAVPTLASALLAPYRSLFYRHARLITGPLATANVLPLLALVACVLCLAAFEPHVRWLTNNSFWEVILSRDVPNSIRATVAMTVVLALGAIWRLLRPTRVPHLPWDANARLHYAALGADPPARADGIVWGENERAAIPYRRIGRVLVGLGDPAGAESDRASAIWRLRDLAQQQGCHPAIWQAQREMLRVYQDLGLTAVPIGPDGNPHPEAPADVDRHARHFLVCVAERDLPVLVPMLPDLSAPHPRQTMTEPAYSARPV